MTREQYDIYIQRCRNKFGDRYEYQSDPPETTLQKIKITCREHGDFEQVLNDHFNVKVGCPKCASVQVGLKVKSNWEDVVLKSNLKHDYKYEYPTQEYTGNKMLMTIICKEHGEFQQRANAHYLHGHGCPHCAQVSRNNKRRITFEDFKDQATRIHNGFYEYPEQEWTGKDKPVTIICPSHGEFTQNGYEHAKGRQCRKCAEESAKSWCRDTFREKCERLNRKATFYIIKCWDEEEEFIKIGITSRDINYRFRGTEQMPYNWEVISKYISTPDEVWTLERDYQNRNRDNHYLPKKNFGGKYECFKIPSLFSGVRMPSLGANPNNQKPNI